MDSLNTFLLFFQQAESRDWIDIIIKIVGGGGLVFAIIALLKLRPEAGQILVTTAQGVVVIQTGVIESLQKEIGRLNSEIEENKKETEKNKKETEECKGRERLLQARVFELERQAGMHETGT